MSKETGYPVMRYKPSSHPSGYESKKVHSSAEAEALGSEWSTHPEHFGVKLVKAPADPEIAQSHEKPMSDEAVKPAAVEELQAKKARASKPKGST